VSSPGRFAPWRTHPKEGRGGKPHRPLRGLWGFPPKNKNKNEVSPL